MCDSVGWTEHARSLHHCLNKRHIYQIHIDLLAILAWYCSCQLDRKKAHHIFADISSCCFIIFVILCDWCFLSLLLLFRSFLCPPSLSSLPPSFSLFTYSICQPCSPAVSSPTFWATSYFLPGPVIKACRTALPWAVESGSEGWRDRWWRNRGREGKAGGCSTQERIERSQGEQCKDSGDSSLQGQRDDFS